MSASRSSVSRTTLSARAGSFDVERGLIDHRAAEGVEDADDPLAGQPLGAVHGGGVRVVEVVELGVGAGETERALVAKAHVHVGRADGEYLRPLAVDEAVAGVVSGEAHPVARAKAHRRGLVELEPVA